MKTSVLIRNARLTDGSAQADLLVSGGVITAKAPAGTLLESAAERALDASGKLVLPGLFDIHAHLCQPGREDKERVATATAAAAATKLYVEGSKVEQYYWVDYVKVTKENAAQYIK